MFHFIKLFLLSAILFMVGCAVSKIDMKPQGKVVPLSSLYSSDTGFGPGVNRDEPIFLFAQSPKQTSYYAGQMYRGIASFCGTSDLAKKYVQKEIDGAKPENIAADAEDDCANRPTMYKPVEVVFDGITKIVKCVEYRELPGFSIMKFETYLITKAPVIL
ncbi:MAG: hypothetical protein HYT94_03160 [Parcubacteria group bacterium]|nr:hypothetical protein [Parcubacteria group bacterium]